MDSLGCIYLSELDPRLAGKDLLLELNKKPITIVNAYARSLKERLGNFGQNIETTTLYLP